VLDLDSLGHMYNCRNHREYLQTPPLAQKEKDMHIHIKNSVEDNLSVYDSDNDDSVVIAILDDSIVTAIVLDLAHDSAVKLHSELSKLLQGYQPPEIEVLPE